MIIQSQFLSKLRKEDVDDKNSFLLESLQYLSSMFVGIVEVPKGFVTDGSSTPRVPIVYWLYGDRAHHEGVLHDYLYRAPQHKIMIDRGGNKIEKKITKKEADNLFLEAMKSRGKPFYVCYGMYLGVKLGGFSSWRTGESRYKIMEVK